MASKNSWRFNFTDIDLSFSISTETGTIKGYTVLRSRKGETEPYYFEKGNAEAIRAYVGLDNANYQDIYEAIEFNKEYGVYLSCPPGSSDNYPSYYGGKYLTSEGLKDFYNISSRDAIDYTEKKLITELGSGCEAKVYVRKEKPYTSLASVDGTKETLAFFIGPISPSAWGNLQEIGINYWGDSRTMHNEGMYYYTINKTDHKIYVEDEDGVAIEDYYCGIWGKSTNGYYIILGGQSWLPGQITSANEDSDPIKIGLSSGDSSILAALGLSTVFSNNTSLNTDAPFFTTAGLSTNLEEATTVASGEGYVVEWEDVIQFFTGGDQAESVAEKLSSEIMYTASDASGTVTAYTVGAPVSPKSNFTALVNIKPKTYFNIFQKSPTEQATTVKIISIGYDKWKYDNAFPLIVGDITKMKREVVEQFTYFVSAAINNDVDTTPKFSWKIYSVDADKSGTNASNIITDVTSKYVSQSFLVYETYEYDAATSTLNQKELGPKYRIFYVLSKTTSVLEKEDDKDYPLIKDLNYNTITFSLSEEVYPGETTSGGEFTGSLDENGKDSYGTNIYWPNVLNENDYTFCDVQAIRTFDDEVNKYGIYTGTRLVDDMLTTDFAGNSVGSSYTMTLKGQRYVTHVVEQNIKEGVPGSTWRDEFYNVLSKGWTEAYDDNYDDVYVFFGLTGQPVEVENLASIVTGTHKLAIAIAPYIVTKSTFNDPSTMVVSTRCKQLALYAGEFSIYDSYTGKTIYITPMGSVAQMCCRIFDRKMGGWPPAWINYNDMGGQLSRTVLKAKWAFNDAATKIMDTKGINPIVYNADDGLMITSSKTTQDPNNLTDWSYLEHTMSFCLVKREIRDNVMRPQIEKPIDDVFIDLRQRQVDAILEKRVSGSNKIWRSYSCDIASAQTDVTKAKRHFVIPLKVKVSPFTQEVDLTLTNVGQTTEI